MASQFSEDVRNARQAAIEATIGAAPTLEFRTGPQPVNCAAADSGDLLGTITLPSDWRGTPSGGASTKLGTWTTTGSAAGVIGHFRVKASSACKWQGAVSEEGGGGDMIVSSVNVAVGQPIEVTTFTCTDGNA